jgi:hypothetical protein
MTDDLDSALAVIVTRLAAAGIPAMLVGSVAGIVHGHSRTTRDVDLVIAPSLDQLRAFVRALPVEDFYCDEDVAVDALHSISQFNVIDQNTGWKFDLLIRKPRAFSREEFARRRTVHAFGTDLDVATIEDTILAKLEWSAAGGGSQRQLDDVRELIRIGGAELDLAYIERWVDALGVRQAWYELRDA